MKPTASYQQSGSARDAGFTVVETMVTVIVSALFIIALNLLYTAVTHASGNVRDRADASDIAYAKLRTFVYSGAKPPASFTCTSSTDLTANANASGLSLTGGKVGLSSSETTLPQPANYEVKAYAPYGCNGAAAGSPILIKSTVTYGSDNAAITHAELVGY